MKYFKGYIHKFNDIINALPFWILTEDLKQLIARSVIRTRENHKEQNNRLDQLSPEQKVIGMKDLIPNVILLSIDPDQLIGQFFMDSKL